MFDVLSTEEIQSIAAANAPEVTEGTREVVAELRAKAMSTGRQLQPVYLRLGKEGLAELLGIRECRPGEIPQHSFGKGDTRVSLTGDWNVNNRQMIESNAAKIFRSMIQGRFVATPETAIVLSDGMIGSAQHRGYKAYEICCTSDPDFTITLCVAFGFDARLADVLDRAAKRSKAAIAQRNNIISDSDFQYETTNAEGETVIENTVNDVSSAVATCNRELGSMLGTVLKRATGRDIKASGEFDEAQFGDMLQRCPDAPALLVRLYTLGKGADGKDLPLVKMFGRPTLGAMLILSANCDNPATWESDGRKRIWELPEHIACPDDDVVVGLLACGGNGPSDPFYELLSKIGKWNDKHPQRKAGACNAAIRHFLATRQLDTVPAPVDAVTGQPLPGAKETKRWVCEPVEAGNVSKFDCGVPEKRSSTNTTPKPYQWFNFGGLDVGYLPPVTRE